MQSTLVTQKSTILFFHIWRCTHVLNVIVTQIFVTCCLQYICLCGQLLIINHSQRFQYWSQYFLIRMSQICVFSSYSCDGHKLLNSNITNISNVFSIFSYVGQRYWNVTNLSNSNFSMLVSNIQISQISQIQISVCTLKCWSHIFKFKYHKYLK